MEEGTENTTGWEGAEPISFNDLAGTLWDQLLQWVDLAVRMLPNIVLAAVVVAVAFLLARVFARLVGSAMERLSDNRQVTDLATTLTRTATVVAGLFAGLSILHLDGVVTSLLAGVGVVGLALGFAFQDIAANFMSGVLMALQRPFRVGDLIETGDHFGTVERVDLRVTRIRTMQGEDVLIPNREVYNNALINHTRTSERRIDIDVGVAYSDDLEQAGQVVETALRGLDESLDDRPVQVFFKEFGGSSINFSARFWIRSTSQAEYLSAQSKGIIAIKHALDDAGLSIPFPIRTLDFGAKDVGGIQLDRVLTPVVDELPLSAK
jgi:small conductance mechanosensitive channel